MSLRMKPSKIGFLVRNRDFFAKQNDTQAIVNSILAMAEALDIKCIIEGVELQEQVDYFKLKGVYGIQGYFFYKPMPGEDLQKLRTLIIC